MKSTWHIRPYREGDAHRILRLREVVFGDVDPVRRMPSTWEWQFLKNPAGKAFWRLAEDKGEIVGQYALIPTRMCVRGEESIFAFSCDTMIHPAYRRKGMFAALADELYRSLETPGGAGVVWGFPNEISLPGFTRKLGWDLLAVFPLRVKPLRPLQMLRSHIPFLRGAKETSLEAGGPEAMEVHGAPPGLCIEPVTTFDSSFDELWNRHKGLAPIIQVRDSRYLTWRYREAAEFGYRPFAVRWRGRLSGYMVIRLMRVRGHYFGVLVDLFPFPVLDEEVTCRLFSFAGDYCRAGGAEFLTCLISPAGDTILKKAGFRAVPGILSPKKWYFGARYGQQAAPLLSSSANWYITYGDSDIV